MYHSLDICQSIAEKLSKPQHTQTIIEEAIKQKKYYFDQWRIVSLTHGITGIAIFYAMMDQSFPDENWDRIAHDYLKLASDVFEKKGSPGYSLFGGLSGLCVAATLCSRQGIRYKKMTEKLDTVLIQEIQNTLNHHANFSELYTDKKFYNLSEGLSGVLIYLSLRKDSPYLQSLGVSCIKKLALSLNDKKNSLTSQKIPGWYIPHEFNHEEEKGKYPNGSFDLTTSYGITGCLSSLAISALEGFCPQEGYDLMERISQWLMRKQGQYSEGLCWKPSISLEEEISNQIEGIDLNRDAWSYGIPAVTRSLFLTSKVLKNNSLRNFAEETFNSMWSKSEKEWNLYGTSFSYGRAGHLAITHHMAKDTGNVFLKNKTQELEEGLKRFYDPNAPFGFRAVGFTDTNDYMWVDDPGLHNGAAGIALSLLMLHKEEASSWDRIFTNT